MTPEEKMAKWKELGEMPDLFHSYGNYIAKATFDYNTKIAYVAHIPTKEPIIFTTTAETFENDVEQHIDAYMKSHNPVYFEMKAVVDNEEPFGYIPGINETLIHAQCFEGLYFELITYVQMEIENADKHEEGDFPKKDARESHAPHWVTFQTKILKIEK